MTNNPLQLLLLLFLGLLAAFVLVAAIALLVRARKPAMHPRGRRQALRILVPLALILWVLAGKFLLSPFFPSAPERGGLPPPLSTNIVQGASGARLAVRHYGSPTGPVLVLTHGWGADLRDWAWVIPNLPQQFHIVTWDLPGLGASTQPEGGEYAMDRLAADLDSVVASLGGQHVLLVGHSIGGMLNLEYARRFPHKMGREVRGLVQVNTTYTNPVETRKNGDRSRSLQEPVLEPLLHAVSWTSPLCRGLGFLAYTSGLAHLQLAMQSFAGAQSWEQLDEMARYAYRSSPGVVARGVLAMLHWDASDVLARISVPTLIVSGNQDVTTLPSASDRMQREIQSSVLEVVNGAAHLGPVEQEQRYALAIAAFTRGQAPALQQAAR
jgi:pimeloyl-ACP methyl ester carboxylesterase